MGTRHPCLAGQGAWARALQLLLFGLLLLPGATWRTAAAVAPRAGASVAASRCCSTARLLPSRRAAVQLQLDQATATTDSRRSHTAESRAKISAANKGKTPWNAGLKHSEETRRRIAKGTRRAFERKMEAQRLERERLRVEEPEEYAKLVADEAAKAVAKAVAEEAKRERKALAKERAAKKARGGGSGKRSVRHPRMTTGPAGSGRVNFTFSEESRAKISASLRARWRDPEYRAKRAKPNMTNETRAAISAAMRAKWQEGGYRQRVTVNGSHSAERKAKIAESIRRKWADPIYRNKTTAAIRKAHANVTRRESRKQVGGPSAEARRKISEAMKRLWQEPSYRQTQLSKMEGRRSRAPPRPPAPRKPSVASAGASGAAGGSAAAAAVAVLDASSAPAAAAARRAQAEADAAAAGYSLEEIATRVVEEEALETTPVEAYEEELDPVMAWGDTIIDFGAYEDDQVDGL